MKLLPTTTVGILCLVSQISSASVVSTTGGITFTSAPTSVVTNATENSTTMLAFNEQQGVTLASSLSVDLLAQTSTAGSIAAGTDINSYFLHFDPVGTDGTQAAGSFLTGSITFDTQILGIIWTAAPCDGLDPDPCPRPATAELLDASDFLGAAGTFYGTGQKGRGLETDIFYQINSFQDLITLSPDGKTINLDIFTIQNFTDQVRIVTAVPVPGAAWLFLSGLVGLLSFKRKGGA